MRSAVLLLLITLTAPMAGRGAAAAPQGAQRSTASKKDTATKKDIDLPPLSYVCPMAGDEDVIEDKAGKCRKCGMTLIPIRLVSVWTCSQQPGLVTRDRPGKCPVDGQPLVQMTMAASWTCPGSPSESNQPGTCPDGTPMKAEYKLRPHGNHNPQHGGQFFMASDNWHHLEGTYPQAGVFRMYLYDDYTKPLARTLERDVSGEVVISGKPYPLALAANGRYLEAKIDATLPAVMQARLKFKPTAPSNVFDFNFEKYSTDPGAVAAPNVTKATPKRAPGDTAPATAATPRAVSPGTAATSPATATAAMPSVAIPSGVDPALIPLPIPDTVPEMLDQLRTRTGQIGALIDKGLFADVYVPAFQAKDVALALEPHEKDLPLDKQRIAEPAIAKLVRAAYLLDAFGDLGNKQQISAAYVDFAEASKEILAAFPQGSR